MNLISGMDHKGELKNIQPKGNQNFVLDIESSIEYIEEVLKLFWVLFEKNWTYNSTRLVCNLPSTSFL